MSFGSNEARLFLEPLKGRSHGILLPDRQSNLALARALLSFFGAGGMRCNILDTDAFYASSLETLLPGRQDLLSGIRLYVPSAEFRIEELFPGPWAGDPSAVIIGNLNALLHKLSADSRPSASRKLAFFIAASSLLARINGSVVIYTVYERSRQGHRRGRGTLFDLANSTIAARVDERGLSLECLRGTAWPGGRFYAPNPSG